LLLLSQDLEPLSTLPRLKYLSLLDNPVTKQPKYRLFVIARCKRLKVLDFRKVKQQVRLAGGRGQQQGCIDVGLLQLTASYMLRLIRHSYGALVLLASQEREEAERLFGPAPEQAAQTFEPEEELKQAEAAVAAARPAAAAVAEPSARKGPTSEQITAIKAAIAAASTLEEVRRLEDALRTGHLPSEITIGGGGEGDGAAAANGASAMEEG
jgi:U2 small nuclear ribonucleoprotein A'